MNHLDSLQLVLDASRSAKHEHTVIEQLRGKGRKSKVIGAGRIIGSTILDRVYSGRLGECMPFSGNLSDSPIGYGVEAVVYKLTSGDHDFAVKVFTKPGNPQEIIDSYKRHQENTGKYLAEHVVPSLFVLASHPFRQRTRIAVGIQEMIDGGNFFDNPNLADKSDVALFVERVNHMRRETDKVPDLAGIGNLLVADCGSLRLVDSGFPINIGAGVQDPFIESRIAALNAYVSN